MDFVADVRQVSRARHWVLDRAGRAGASAASMTALELLTSEAVTNAVVHGPRGGTVSLEVDTTAGRVRVSVSDESHDLPQVREVANTALGGRGVQFIDRFSSRWGCQSHPGDGKTLWFEVPLAV